MVSKNQISLFLATFLIIGFIFLALPENGYSGIQPTLPPLPSGCCQYIDEGQDICANISGSLICPILDVGPAIDFFEGESCNQNTGLCIDPAVNSPIPTLSEWGLIAMAGILGIVGFMVIRRRKATA